MCSLLKCCCVVSLKVEVGGILPLRTLFHEEESVTSISVTARVHDFASRGKRNILESLDFVPETSSGVEMMDLQLA